MGMVDFALEMVDFRLGMVDFGMGMVEFDRDMVELFEPTRVVTYWLHAGYMFMTCRVLAGYRADSRGSAAPPGTTGHRH